MKLLDILQKTNLDNSLLVGYYGGGNYGDELLLEVLMNILSEKNTKKVSIAYQYPERYSAYHRDFGYSLVNIHRKKQFIAEIMRRKNIIMGGGGHWGMDANTNILLLSILLLFARVLGKNVYLLGVGYYNSTNKIGRLSAYLSAKAARYIVVRDNESMKNFQKYSRRISQDHDIAFLIPNIHLSEYAAQSDALAKSLKTSQQHIFITLRRFEDNRAENYYAKLEECFTMFPDKQFLISLLQPANDYHEGYKLINHWSGTYPNVEHFPVATNPLALVHFFRTHAKNFRFITPQFHAIITAMLCNIPYYPVAYDNKVSELLSSHEITDIQKIDSVDSSSLKAFIAAG